MSIVESQTPRLDAGFAHAWVGAGGTVLDGLARTRPHGTRWQVTDDQIRLLPVRHGHRT